jgi:hypothetical protein
MRGWCHCGAEGGAWECHFGGREGVSTGLLRGGSRLMQACQAWHAGVGMHTTLARPRPCEPRERAGKATRPGLGGTTACFARSLGLAGPTGRVAAVRPCAFCAGLALAPCADAGVAVGPAAAAAGAARPAATAGPRAAAAAAAAAQGAAAAARPPVDQRAAALEQVVHPQEGVGGHGLELHGRGVDLARLVLLVGARAPAAGWRAGLLLLLLLLLLWLLLLLLLWLLLLL